MAYEEILTSSILQDNTENSSIASKSTSTDGGLYAVELDAAGDLAVRVPWTDSGITYSVATSSSDGLMSSTDKAKLDSLDGNGGNSGTGVSITSGTAGMKPEENYSILPYKAYGSSAVVYNNEIHILGGADEEFTNGLTNHYKYNNIEWINASILPYKFYIGSIIVYNNEIHILGGAEEGIETNHYKYNSTEWTEISILPYEFYCSSAVVYNNEIHILGGLDIETYAGLTNHYKYNGTEWTEVSTLPYGFCYGSAIIYNNEIHVLGGGVDDYYTSHYKYNGTEWTSVSTLPYEFVDGSAIIYNNEIHVLGGGVDDYYTSHYKYNGTEWTSVSTLPYEFAYGSAVVYNDEIHILGGIEDGTDHYKFNGTEWTKIIIPTTGSTIEIPYVTVNSDGVVTDYGVREHIVPNDDDSVKIVMQSSEPTDHNVLWIDTDDSAYNVETPIQFSIINGVPNITYEEEEE